MGNSTSSSGRGHHDDSVDYGALVPQGIYTGPRDWNQAKVSQFIIGRKLAPFYRPLEEYDESWDDDQILAARKEIPEQDNVESNARIDSNHPNGSRSGHNKRTLMVKEPGKPEAVVYRGAVECPICFLYYPPNINHSRCCGHAICTECFVQIKRNEPTATHLVSEPAACPYCVQDNFGIVYTPPLWRAGIGSEGMAPIWSDSPKSSQQSIETSSSYPTHKRRQKSIGADSPEVVTTDQIRPDWEAKLAAVRAAVTRRANRRIIMRQVGDRLIPVGVTSGRVHALSPEEAGAEVNDGGGSRRSRRRQQAQQQGFEQFMGMGGQDLEELMLMEAMRLSLIDHEEHQRKEAEEKRKQEQAAAAQSGGDLETSGPGPSTLEARPSNQPSNPPTSQTTPSFLSPTPTHPSSSSARTGSNESLGHKKNARSLSRNRTPSPANTSNYPSEWENPWRDRPSGPPPFSTLNAALATASTASAFLAPWQNENNLIGNHTSRTEQDASPQRSISNNSEPPSINLPIEVTEGFNLIPARVLSSSTSLPENSETESLAYGHLGSSSELSIVHEPLLGLEAKPQDERDLGTTGQEHEEHGGDTIGTAS